VVRKKTSLNKKRLNTDTAFEASRRHLPALELPQNLPKKYTGNCLPKKGAGA
jgi:hypothetical protein